MRTWRTYAETWCHIHLTARQQFEVALKHVAVLSIHSLLYVRLTEGQSSQMGFMRLICARFLHSLLHARNFDFGYIFVDLIAVNI